MDIGRLLNISYIKLNEKEYLRLGRIQKFVIFLVAFEVNGMQFSRHGDTFP